MSLLKGGFRARGGGFFAGLAGGGASDPEVPSDGTKNITGNLDVSGSITGGSVLVITGGTLSGSSGTERLARIDGTIGQSGTAAYTGLSIAVTESSTGSGAKNLINTTVGGSSMFSVSNAGVLTCASNIVSTAGTLSVSADADAISLLGRLRISSALATDNAYLSHFDQTAAGDGWLRFNNAGEVAVNVKTGQAFEIKVNGNGRIKMDNSIVPEAANTTTQDLGANTAAGRWDTLYVTAVNITGKQTYTPTNVTTDRAFDADTALLAEVADVLGTLIADLQVMGVLG